ncbi:ABC transporter ATP-binding protein [Nocardioides kribbensis]|uniref:ABC transporter ATP-binding protein n=1 Tax=Nocardioides kribbensis TaxID=305517 RepID=UPI00187B0B41|nr:ABC transporter ATP-binding protein [Nocardioides kribbensis]
MTAAPPAPPALEARGLSVGYGDGDVVHDLDLTVTDGVTAILGPSGCGKTTLLRTVAGFVTPRTGTVTVAGRPVVADRTAVAPRHRRLGYVPQEGGLFPHLDVAANVVFGLPRSQRRAARATVASLLELVDLPDTLADRYPHELSGGQQQRVALARALAPRPSMVLLDEPFSSLDAGLREETGRAVVRALRRRGAAALLVTHDQGEALSLADQVAVMHSGRLLQVGRPAAVYLSPADERVADFVGLSVFLDGTVAGSAPGAVRCALGEIGLRSPAPAGPVRVAVRAEQVQVTSAERGVAAEVLDTSFFGHDATVRVRLATGELVVARTPAGVVPLPGERVGVVVTGDVVAFASDRRP